jgi:uncharacterized membrane protein (DUF4010 family)
MFPTETNHLLRSLLLSASLGALIGLERQWDDQFRHHRSRVLAGLRTFTLWSIFGDLCAWFTQTINPLFFIAGFAAMGIWLTLFLQSRNRGGGDPGFTTGAAGMISFLIGGLVFWGQERVAIVLAVCVIILLAIKPTLHRFTRGITLEDVRAALKFAAVTGVILPLVPDETFGPYQAFNPHTIWLMVVLVSGIGFAGYLAVRVLGQRNGIALTGLLGGIVSSTATTLAMSRQSRERPLESADCALAILLACTIMPLRVGLLLAFVNTRLLAVAWGALMIISMPGVVWCLWRLLHGGIGSGSAHDPAKYGNPLRLRVAFQFGGLYAVIVLVVKATMTVTGSNELLLVSGLSGLIDLDAITLSLSQMTGIGSLTSVIMIKGIMLAILANTAMKAAIAVFFGSPGLVREVVIVLGITAFFVIATCFFYGH